MTIYYVDMVNGNDANTGLSWAQAWKTSLNGPTAARTTPGDTFRFAKTPDPTSVGTATWTTEKIGNSITFSSAPTKQIDLCQSGWVTLGAGATVTNNQSTAFILGTPGTPGTGSALQVVTSATTNGAYKNLGSTQDFSAHQQVCFWFRSSSAFDCTGSQNLTVRLCSDTAGVTVVDSLVVPKWSYSANVWYPLVIDKGSALGSSIQSVSYVTTNNTTQTFYFAEMFASPAAGLTLQSLIGKYTSSATEEYDWFPIKTIRDADVWLHGAIAMGTATGACLSNSLNPSYIGTTETVTTYKRECIRPFGSSGPSATAFLTTNEAGTVTTAPASNLYTWSGGWDTGTTVQDGETWLDQLVQLGAGISQSHAYNQYESFGLVRCGAGVNTGSQFSNLTDISLVGNTSISISSSSFDQRKQIGVVWNLKCVHATGAQPSISASNTVPGSVINVGNCWGNYGYVQFGGISQAVLTIRDVASVGGGTYSALLGGINRSTVNMGKINQCRTTAYPAGQVSTGVLATNSDAFSIINVVSIKSSNSSAAPCLLPVSSCNSVFNVGEFLGIGVAVGVNTINDAVINGGIISTTGGAFYPGSAASLAMMQTIFHNYNNTAGVSRVYKSQQSTPALYWELQGTDVRTPGTKAWKISISGISTGAVGNTYDVMGVKNDLKLASVAAVAGSLVTVNCYVKRSSAAQDVGIYIDGASRFVPGYTADIVDTCSSSGSYELVTVTFTPTADCVFDVYAFVTYTSTNSVDCTWADLSITQA